ncbi:hypothetical protein NUSPORA_02575 [Nucleospora cyclopteri]
MNQNKSNENSTDFLIKTIANFIGRDFGSNIEIEARLGRIKSKITDERISFSTVGPVIFKDLPLEMTFEGAVNEGDFKYLRNKMSNKNLPIKDSKDVVFIGNKGRKILMENNSVKMEKKVRLENLSIYMPKNTYDLRISISREIPLPENTVIDEKIKRERERRTVLDKKFVYDFTRIKFGGKVSYEVEVECIGIIEAVEFYKGILQVLEK